MELTKAGRKEPIMCWKFWIICLKIWSKTPNTHRFEPSFWTLSKLPWWTLLPAIPANQGSFEAFTKWYVWLGKVEKLQLYSQQVSTVLYKFWNFLSFLFQGICDTNLLSSLKGPSSFLHSSSPSIFTSLSSPSLHPSFLGVVVGLNALFLAHSQSNRQL